jgi:hypothetical protein
MSLLRYTSVGFQLQMRAVLQLALLVLVVCEPPARLPSRSSLLSLLAELHRTLPTAAKDIC